MQIGQYSVRPGGPLFVIAGPCVIEGRDHALGVAVKLAAIADRLGVDLIFKSSFDKANRTSKDSPRGPGLDAGLAILAEIRSETGLPVLTDVHETAQVAAVAGVADVVQIPAFLSRQTDLIQAAAASGRIVNVKKGQFMAPGDVAQTLGKVAAVLPDGVATADRVMLCERGTTFGYHDLVVDMRGLATLRATGVPVVFDASHAVQRPGAGGSVSGGAREFVPLLARAAAGAGIDGLFVETHPDVANAWSDAATVWPLDRIEKLIADVRAIHDQVRDRDMMAEDHG